MIYLTEKENDFINALKEDEKIRGEKSFIYTLFLSSFLREEHEFKKSLSATIKLDLLKKIDPEGYQILSNTDWLFESMDSRFIGKYKNYFMSTWSEGEYFPVGTEIQNIPTNIIYLKLGDSQNSEELEEIIEYFKDDLDIDYLFYIEDYKKFCSKFGLIYNDNELYIRQQCESFENDIQE